MNKEIKSQLPVVGRNGGFLVADPLRSAMRKPRRLGKKAQWLMVAVACGVVSFGCLAATSPAQEATTAARRLTLREAIDLALRNNRNIQLAQAGVSRAAAEHDEARSAFRPQVFLGSGVAYTAGFPLSIEGSAPSIFQVSSSQALFDQNLRNQERQAGQMQQAAGKSLVDTEDQIVTETVLAYLSLDRSHQSLQYVRSETESLQAVQQITSDRVEAGLELPLEATRAQLSTARSRSDLTALQNQISMLEFRLRDLTGISQSEKIVTEAAEIPALAANETLDSLISRAMANNPSLRALDEEVRAKEFQVKSEKGSRWPRINLVGQYGLFSKINNYDQYFQKFARNNATLGLSIVVPVYQRASYNARLSKAEAELAETRYRREQTRADISRQVRELWGTIQQQTAARDVRRLELELARKSLDAVLAKYEEGRVNRLTVEQSRVDENHAWVNLLNADFDAERARLELWRLTGEIRTAFN